MPIITVICFTYALLLTLLANIPYKNSKRFVKFWRIHLVNKEDHKPIRACKTTGVILGPYGFGRAQLGINICDDMIHSMITIILLGGL